MRLTRRRFSIRTSELSEGHFLGVKKMAAGLAKKKTAGKL